MTGDADDEAPASEDSTRKVVREELRSMLRDQPTRRRVLQAASVAGLASLAGCSSSQGSQSGSGLTVTNNGSKTQSGVSTLNLRRNLSTTFDGDQVNVDALHGVDAALGGDQTTRVSTIDVGDGLSGSVSAETLTLTRSNGQQSGLTYVAEPGDLQGALDDAVADGIARVRLANGARYELGSSIEVPPGVVLDCTGGTLAATSDVNVFELHTQSQVFNPQVETSGVSGYSSTIFHVFPGQFDESFGTNRTAPTWTVSGGFSEMTPGEGTCIELHGARKQTNDYDSDEHNYNVYFCYISHNCYGGRRFAHLHREGGKTTRGGHVNGNIIRGYADNATRFIDTNDSAGDRKNMVNGNKFYLQTQPGSETRWLWYANKGRLNELYEWGTNWDYGSYSDEDGDGYAESWYIGQNAGMNFLWRRQTDTSGGLGSSVLDDSEGDSGSRYLVLEKMGVPVSDLEVWKDAK
jgi:hypothetical protein